MSIVINKMYDICFGDKKIKPEKKNKKKSWVLGGGDTIGDTIYELQEIP
jgi:hypothetical protein